MDTSKILNIEEYSGMIWSIINKRGLYYFSHPLLDTETLKKDLYSEASLAYLEAKSSWDSTNEAKFSTWLHIKVSFKIRNYLNRKINKILAEEAYLFDDIEITEDETSYIDEKQATDISKLFEKAYGNWSFEKCWYLYYIVAFDETLKYNQNLKNFMVRYKDDIGNIPYEQDLSDVDDDTILDFHKFSCDYHKKTKNNKLINNIRNSIKYHIKVN